MTTEKPIMPAERLLTLVAAGIMLLTCVLAGCLCVGLAGGAYATTAQSAKRAAAATATLKAQMTALQVAETAWRPVEVDTFESPIKHWPTGILEDKWGTWTLAISSGKYQWICKANQGAHFRRVPNNYQYLDFYLSVDGKKTDDRTGFGFPQYGLVFRENDDGDFYSFRIKDSGKYVLQGHSDATGQWHTLIDWTAAEAIRRDQANQLAVLAQGDHFTLFINDQYVAEATDSTFKQGRVGLAVDLEQSGDTATFEFSNFEVRQP